MHSIPPSERESERKSEPERTAPPSAQSTSSPRAQREFVRLGLFLALACLATCLASCSREGAEGDGASGAQALEDARRRERIAALFARDTKSEALEELRPLLERAQPAREDLLAAGILERAAGDYDAARAHLLRALEGAPDDAAVNYNLGILDLETGDFESAEERLARAHELLPDDVPTRLALASVVQDDDPERALELYSSIRAEGLDAVGGLYLTTLYRISQIADEEEAAEARDELAELQARGLEMPRSEDVMRGTLGTITPPAPQGGKVTSPGAIPSFAAARVEFPEFAGAAGLLVEDLDNDGENDVLAWGPFGLAAGLRPASGAYVVPISESAPDLVLAFDLGNDDDLDLVFATGDELRLHTAELYQEMDDGPMLARWSAVGRTLATLPSAPSALVPVDFDHDGDLDLALAGEFGASLWRNDGAAASGAFVDATAAAELPTTRAFTWILTEDYDTDQDVDLLFGGPAALFLATNLRGGRFGDASANLAGLAPSELPFLSADLDGDGRPDLVRLAPRAEELEVTVARVLPSGKYELTTQDVPMTAALQRAELVDLDLDGAVDLALFGSGARVTGLQSIGLGAARSFVLALETAQASGASAATGVGTLVDYDSDLAWEAVFPRGDGVAIHDASAPAGRALLFALRGVKDNRRGIGAIVELRSGTIFSRTYWRGRTELVGLGPQCELDWLRITWPNGVIQYDPRLDCGDRRVTADTFAFLQAEGLEGSCPFLYTWNGETFEFITDVLGITPLGLPLAPGMLVPPDHDEFVLVRGEQLVPEDGWLELQFTEELREVTYLDHLRLDVVDHPADTEIFPNERFTFPPFPEPHTHTVRGALAPQRASDLEGRVWTSELAADDDVFAAPFELAPSQYQGLATPHTLELAFDADAVRTAKKLRLVMTGWFYWTNASVNMATARDPEWEFVPPLLTVPDGQGGWRETGPPLGFPAGKTKTMVIDVTDILDRDDPRLRLFSTLRLYWDSIRLAIDDDDAELRVTGLTASSSKLWRRGFSAPLESDDPHQPARFEWDSVAPRPRWNPHPGLYTKLGDVLPLVTAVDDQFVVLGTGDALTVRFDARALPPVPAGFRRDYLVYLDGWAKDRDPNTLEALYVEPLPFHGMSGYPYGPGESFPDDAAHRAWRHEWQTRPAEPWIQDARPPARALSGAP